MVFFYSYYFFRYFNKNTGGLIFNYYSGNLLNHKNASFFAFSDFFSNYLFFKKNFFFFNSFSNLNNFFNSTNFFINFFIFYNIIFLRFNKIFCLTTIDGLNIKFNFKELFFYIFFFLSQKNIINSNFNFLLIGGNDFLKKLNNCGIPKVKIYTNLIYKNIFNRRENFFLKNISLNYNNSFLYKKINNYFDINIMFLRKNRQFNKGRYSRNRQNYKTGVYWCLYVNIVAIFTIYYFFYRFSFNFGYLWWIGYFGFTSFFFNKFFKFNLFKFDVFSNNFTKIFFVYKYFFLLIFNFLKQMLKINIKLKKNFDFFFFNLNLKYLNKIIFYFFNFLNFFKKS